MATGAIVDLVTGIGSGRAVGTRILSNCRVRNTEEEEATPEAEHPTPNAQ